MFLHLCVILFTGEGLCPSMHHRSDDQGGLCPGGVSVWGRSVQGVSVHEGLCPGDLSERPPWTETPPYGNARTVCILLECILVLFSFQATNEMVTRVLKAMQRAINSTRH